MMEYSGSIIAECTNLPQKKTTILRTITYSGLTLGKMCLPGVQAYLTAHPSRASR